MEEIPIPLRELLALLEADPSSDEDEGRQILKAYFDEVHQILLGPYPGTSTDPAVIDRHRLVAFLDRTTILLRRIGAGEHLFNKLMIFSAALRDMDRGVASPIFTPRNLSHSPPLSSAIWRLRHQRRAGNERAWTARGEAEGRCGAMARSGCGRHIQQRRRPRRDEAP